ncbi:MAG: divalent-cation tolerance protein CutA [Nitrospina sp.]|nr:divalent-cation tolerance protein CutA [Nitrospina sp.]MBT6602010.1 divalent-cation tolerance protein CutA [Nitrospina sp.]
MNEHIVILTTAGSEEEATKISRGLVEKKLAYCVNTIPSIQSTYYWDGKLCVDDELLLIIKTKEEKFSTVKDWILANHSYDVPEVIALPITQGSSDYLQCIDEWIG